MSLGWEHTEKLEHKEKLGTHGEAGSRDSLRKMEEGNSSSLAPLCGENQAPAFLQCVGQPLRQLFGIQILCDMSCILSRSGGVPNMVGRSLRGLKTHSVTEDVQGEVFVCSMPCYPSSALVPGLTTETQPC